MRSSPRDTLIDATTRTRALMTPVRAPVSADRTRLVLLAPSHVDRPRNRPFAALAARLRWSVGFERVTVAHLDAEPHLADVLATLAADGAGQVRILPLFLAMASHVRRELRYRMVEASDGHPGLEIRLLPLLGEENALFELLETLARRELADSLEAVEDPEPHDDPPVRRDERTACGPSGRPDATLVPVAEAG